MYNRNNNLLSFLVSFYHHFRPFLTKLHSNYPPLMVIVKKSWTKMVTFGLYFVKQFTSICVLFSKLVELSSVKVRSYYQNNSLSLRLTKIKFRNHGKFKKYSFLCNWWSPLLDNSFNFIPHSRYCVPDPTSGVRGGDLSEIDISTPNWVIYLWLWMKDWNRFWIQQACALLQIK